MVPIDIGDEEPDGDEDPEHPYSRRKGPKLQRDLMADLDEWRAAGLQRCRAAAGVPRRLPGDPRKFPERCQTAE